MSLKLLRTDSGNADFRMLVTELDRDLAVRNGDEDAFFAQFNKIDTINNVVVAYQHGAPIGCGAFKEYEPGTMEIKRMYVQPVCRGKGVASAILGELERWVAELGYTTCILETGEKQPEAIRLYQKNGYLVIPNYGQYVDVASSVCFRKVLLGYT